LAELDELDELDGLDGDFLKGLLWEIKEISEVRTTP
jgi:hypothetical protein